MHALNSLAPLGQQCVKERHHDNLFSLYLGYDLMAFSKIFQSFLLFKRVACRCPALL